MKICRAVLKSTDNHGKNIRWNVSSKNGLITRSINISQHQNDALYCLSTYKFSFVLSSLGQNRDSLVPVVLDWVEHFIAIDKEADEILFEVRIQSFPERIEEILNPYFGVSFLCNSQIFTRYCLIILLTQFRIRNF